MRRPTGKAWRYAAASIAAIGAVVLALAFWWVIVEFLDGGFGRCEPYRGPGDSATYLETRRAERTPQWSADGQTIIINDGSRIIGVPVNGGEAFSITGAGGKEQYSPSVSPEGRVAYQIGVDQGGCRQYEQHVAVASLYDDHLKLVDIDIASSPVSPMSVYPVWSYNGAHIAFVTQLDQDVYAPERELTVLNDDGSLTRNFPVSFTSAPWRGVLSEHRYNTTGRVVWSRDDKQIAYLGFQPTGSSQRLYRLSVIGADGSNDRRILQKWGLISLPEWSPANDRLYFVHSERREGSWEASLYSIGADGSDERLIVEIPSAPVYEISLSPDGTTLLIGGTHTVKTDGTDLAPLNTQPSTYASWSPDGRRIAVYHVNEAGSGVLLRTMNAGGSEPRTIFGQSE